MPTNPSQRAPWQFSVATMLIVVALLALGFTLGKLPLGHAGLMIIVLVLLIAAHVVGNALGMHLRDHSSLQQQQEPLPIHAQPLQREPLRSPVEVPTHMRERDYPGWWIIVSLVIGISGGALGGARVFWSWYEHSFSSWLLGTLSAAVIGGIFSFILSSFLVMSFRAWREATRDHEKLSELKIKD